MMRVAACARGLALAIPMRKLYYEQGINTEGGWVRENRIDGTYIVAPVDGRVPTTRYASASLGASVNA